LHGIYCEALNALYELDLCVFLDFIHFFIDTFTLLLSHDRSSWHGVETAFASLVYLPSNLYTFLAVDKRWRECGCLAEAMGLVWHGYGGGGNGVGKGHY
jgi:hypothetical protein